jgi:hypothetical protein
MRTLSFITFLTLMVSQGPAAEHSASPILQQAYDRLLSVGYFGFGEIQRGWGGPYLISPGEQSLRTLAESTNGLPLLRATLTNGTTAAKLYALCGVQHLAPEQFDSLAAPLARTNSMVGVRVSWIGMVLPTSNMVAQIKSGSYEEFLPSKEHQP